MHYLYMTPEELSPGRRSHLRWSFVATALAGCLACSSGSPGAPSGLGGAAPGTGGMTTNTGGRRSEDASSSGGAGGRPGTSGTGLGRSDASEAESGSTDGVRGPLDAGLDAPKNPVTAAPGATLVKIDPSAKRQTFEGWGTSIAWWGNRVGGWNATARNALVDAIVDPVNGLGYNIFRYNIGGGENPAHTHMTRFRQMPGFEPSQGTWAWDADANQTAILQRIVERGSGVILEAFSNSPPYWMTKSGCASGNTDGSNNLKDDSYDAFADYLTEVVKHYRDALGITFRTLEPLNEPNATWWTANGTQEGCHFSAQNQQQIVKAVGASLAAKGLIGTAVSASDENSLDDAYNILRTYDTASLALVAQMNSHSYSGSARATLRQLATTSGKRLWQSESGPLNVTLATDIDSAIFMAGRIMTDLRDLQPNAWIDWQVVDSSGQWSTLAVNDTQQTFRPVKRFYMHSGFSRFIRPGATMLALSGPDMVAALSADGATLALIVRNGDMTAAKSFTFDLTALASVGTQLAVYRVSRTEDLAPLAPIVLTDWSFTLNAPAYSVTTVVIPVGL